jgi:hypothetical protein
MDKSAQSLRQVLVPRSLEGCDVTGMHLVVASLEVWQTCVVVNISCSCPEDAAAVPGLVLEDHLGTGYECTSVLRAGRRICQIFEPAVPAAARSLSIRTPQREGTGDGVPVCSVSVPAQQRARFHTHGRIRINTQRPAASSGHRT